MKVDEKCARQLYDELLVGYFEKMVRDGLILDYECSFVESTPIINLTCYFSCSDSENIKKVGKRLYCKMSFSVVKGYKYIHEAPLVDHQTNFGYIRNKVVERIKERTKGEKSESRAIKLLYQLKQEGNWGICDIFKGSEYSDNTLKLDVVFLVQTRMPKVFFNERIERFMLGFNVKSSLHYQKKHKYENPRAPSIFCGKDLSDEEIKQNMKNMIKNSLIFLHSEFLASLIKDDTDYSFNMPFSALIRESRNKIHQ